MELIEGGLDRLKDEFSEVFCDGEHGIFVIGIDRSDPGFTEGLRGSPVLQVGEEARRRLTR